MREMAGFAIQARWCVLALGIAACGPTPSSDEGGDPTEAASTSAGSTDDGGASEVTGEATSAALTTSADSSDGSESSGLVSFQCGFNTCVGGQMCDWAKNSCTGDWMGFDDHGYCLDIPEGCDAVYEPVCGCDGEVYGNPCEAYSVGVDLDYLGGCEAPPDTFQCGDHFCPIGTTYCHLDSSDLSLDPHYYTCRELAAECDGVPSCDCVEVCSNFRDWCVEEDGNVLVSC